jgi:hypothetical protein
MVVEPSTEVIVAKASGSFAVDSFTIPFTWNWAWIDKVKKKNSKKDAS